MRIIKILILINFIKNQNDCSNSLILLIDNVKTLKEPQILEEKYIECFNITKKVCCHEDYYKNLGDKFYNSKKNHLLRLNFIYEKVDKFILDYKEFMNLSFKIFPQKLPFITNSTISNEILLLNYQLDLVKNNTKQCFSQLWQHYGTMLCLSCSSEFNTFLLKLRNKTIHLTLNEDVCQKTILECEDFANSYFVLSEKSRFLFEILRKMMNLPDYNNEEKILINEYSKKIDPLKDCYLNKMCRKLCYEFIKINGIDYFYTEIEGLYFNWFSEYFRIFKKFHELEKLETIKSETKKKNIKIIKKFNNRLLQISLDTEVVFSNNYEFNSYNLSSKVDNMTFIDEIKSAAIISLIFIINYN